MFSSDPFSICVKRHMNNKFKTNLVALLAIVSGSALGSGTCSGMQDSANAEMAIGTGIVRPAESSHAGAFGGVVPATNDESYYRRELPPIVSPAQADSSLPPIVSAEKAIQGDLRPVEKLPTAKKLLAKKLQPKKMAMLAPIVNEQPADDQPQAIDPTMAPPAIIQASNASGDAPDSSEISQAAQWSPSGYAPGATSSAGIPLYTASAQGSATSQPIIAQGSSSSQPIIAQGSSSSQPIITQGSSSTQGRSSSQPFGVPPIISSDSELVTPSSSFAPAPFASSAIPAPPTFDPTFTPTESTTFSPQYLSVPPTEAPVIASPSCNSCGGGCSGGCSTPVTSVTSVVAPAPVACGQCAGGGCSDCGIASGVGGAVTSQCQSCGNNGCYDAASIAARAGSAGSVPASTLLVCRRTLLDSRRWRHH